MAPQKTQWQTILSWVLRIAAALIFLQTLYFKFTGAPESVYIFQTMGAEPWGRYASGAVELVAAILLLAPRTAWMGAALGLGVISGAILSHLTKLGIDVQGDGGTLFYLALTVFVCCAGTLWLHRKEIWRLR